MSSYNGSRFILNGGVVNNHTVINKQNYRESALTTLLEESHPEAFHNSKTRSPPVTCHRGTRTPILQAIVKSDEDIKTLSHPFLWLSGHPGAGKSTIAQTIAEDLFKSKSLAAAYFFPYWCRGDRVIATITYQLIQNIPAVRPFVESAIGRNPAVFHLSLSQQAQELILEPFRQLRKAAPDLDVSLLPRIIIIDGLDNCSTKQIPLVLNALSHLVYAQETFPFAVFVTSRPGDSIEHWFHTYSQPAELYPAAHDDVNYNNKDIIRFVTDKMNEIVESHPQRHLLPPGWVSQELIRAVVYRAAGQFVTAKTMMHHICQPKCVPSHRLHNILNDGEGNGCFRKRCRRDYDYEPLLLWQVFPLIVPVHDDHNLDSGTVSSANVSVGTTPEDCFDEEDFSPLKFDSLEDQGWMDMISPRPIRMSVPDNPPVMIARRSYDILQSTSTSGSSFEFIQPSPASLPILIQPSSNFGSPFEALRDQYRR